MLGLVYCRYEIGFILMTFFWVLQAMNGQYLCNRQITVSYAFKKDTKGERHGTPAGQILVLKRSFLIISCMI